MNRMTVAEFWEEIPLLLKFVSAILTIGCGGVGIAVARRRKAKPVSGFLAGVMVALAIQFVAVAVQIAWDLAHK